MTQARRSRCRPAGPASGLPHWEQKGPSEGVPQATQRTTGAMMGPNLTAAARWGTAPRWRPVAELVSVRASSGGNMGQPQHPLTAALPDAPTARHLGDLGRADERWQVISRPARQGQAVAGRVHFAQGERTPQFGVDPA